MTDPLDIEKGSRHSKIIGSFGEAFLCNWLSRSGFEVSIVDHTGLDLVAFNPRTGHRLGITVKSRTRHAGTETGSVNIFSNRKRPSDRDKLRAACETFACEAWVAIDVETERSADLYLMSLEHFDRVACPVRSRTVDTWKMSEKHKRRYDMDKSVQHIGVEFKAHNWAGSDQKA